MPEVLGIDLKIVDNNLKYDLNKHIFLKTNLGELKIDFKDALEIMHTLLDATGHLNTEMYELIEDIEDEII